MAILFKPTGTALHYAAFKGNLLAVELLLEAKADVCSRKHRMGLTPLHVAAIQVCVVYV